MRRSDPFKSIRRFELDVKRHSLYEAIKTQLKLEAYDDQPTGHDFVTSLEKQVPGLITTFSNNHSFLNSTDEENRKVIMEAVDSGMALKAGIAVALATLIFKIISVLINNKDFSKDAPGGGRGTPTYKHAANEAAKTAVNEAKSAKDKAKSVISANKSNPLHQDEDSPGNKAAVKAARVQASVLPTPEEQNNAASKPAEVVANVSILADVNGLASLFALKDEGEFKRIIEGTIKVQTVITSDIVESCVNAAKTLLSATKSTTTTEQAFQWYNSIFNTFKRIHTGVLDSEGSDVSLMCEKLKEHYSNLGQYQVSYQAQEDKSKLLTVVELTDAFENGAILKRSEAVGSFNENVLNNILKGKSDLADSSTYEMYINVLKEITEQAAELRSSGGDDGAALAEKLTLTKMMLEVVLHTLKLVLSQRRTFDTVDSFIKTNTERYTELSALYTNVTSAYEKDGGLS